MYTAAVRYSIFLKHTTNKARPSGMNQRKMERRVMMTLRKRRRMRRKREMPRKTETPTA